MSGSTYRDALVREGAIRGFAEELKARAETEYYHDVETGHTFIYKTVTVDDIDDLVAELVAEIKAAMAFVKD